MVGSCVISCRLVPGPRGCVSSMSCSFCVIDLNRGDVHSLGFDRAAPRITATIGVSDSHCTHDYLACIGTLPLADLQLCVRRVCACRSERSIRRCQTGLGWCSELQIRTIVWLYPLDLEGPCQEDANSVR